jgi:hypothetical protein
MPDIPYFAWVEDGEAFNPATHARQDEEVIGFEISESEGGKPQLLITIRHPRVGFISSGRPRHAWLSLDTGSGAQPLFHGILSGVPEDLASEKVELRIVAHPSDLDAQMEALAETLRVPPFYDPAWLSEKARLDPNAVLEARPARWHVHRVGHDLIASDLIAGEAGMVDFGTNILRDSLRMRPASAPLRKIVCEAVARWKQAAVGEIDVTPRITQAFQAAGTRYPGMASTHTGEGLERLWFVPGARIGGGWSIGQSTIERLDPRSVQTFITTFQTTEGTAGFPIWHLRPYVTAAYDVERSRTETMRFEVTADVQPVHTEAGQETTLTVTRSTGEVGEPIDPGGAIPIGDLRRKSYFLTDRGKQSLEWLIVWCRAMLLDRARSFQVSAEMDFLLAKDITCRHSARFADPRIPGGECTGKVVAYRLTWYGGTRRAHVTIAAAVGNGNDLAVEPGAEAYVDAGYVDAGYQITVGGAVEVAGADIAYSNIDDTVIDDDGVDFFSLNANTAVAIAAVTDGETAQANMLKNPETTFTDVPEAITALNEIHTVVCVAMHPLVGGPFETHFAVDVSPLMVPKTVDLEAEEGSA